VKCDHHDLPLVCGECKHPLGDDPSDWTPSSLEGHLHDPKPSHILVDPEGIEGDWIIPCPDMVYQP
jgi:hypothetical protein